MNASSQARKEMLSDQVFNVLPGLVLAITVGYIAYLVSGLNPLLDALIVALVGGMVIRGVVGNREYLNPGVTLARQLFIPIGLILFGVKLDFVKIFSLGWPVMLVTVLMQIAVFVVILWLNRYFKVGEKTALLIGTGTAICGASAIAVATPCLDAESKDTSIALLVVTILGAIGTAIYVAFAPFGMSVGQFAFLTANSLQFTGYVTTAASVVAGAKDIALSVKVFRTALLAVIAVVLGYRQSRIAKRTTGKGIAIPVPWFVLVMLGVGILVSFGVPLDYGKYASTAGGIIFAMALAAIGLDVNWIALRVAGLKPVWLGLWGMLTAIVIALVGAWLVAK